ncbi:MAG: hypothetical protein CVU39_02215 [Chloroflexi bacterium HGW-Chloroflexi-10]|nr:MAG: hypothetical protein CVU39_02215 [Chloroflexi bacterium HGW-Chloroflexi-10]
MGPNPVLKRLGFDDTDRLVVIHTDDIGMCQASVSAFSDLSEVGVISSGAVMMPCPWALAAVGIQLKNPVVDLGVHITLTSEWKNYRWGPLSTRDVKSGLIDNEGYFYHRAKPAQEHADPVAAKMEMEEQIRLALQVGLKPTHIDTHMGTVAHQKFMLDYIQLGLVNHLPPMLFRMDENGWRQNGLDENTAKLAVQIMMNLEAQGVPLFDHLRGMPLDTPENRKERTLAQFAELPVGLSHFIIHPSKNTPELQAITPDWPCRVADYDVFIKAEMKELIQNLGIHIIGYRELQQLLPSSPIVFS